MVPPHRDRAKLEDLKMYRRTSIEELEPRLCLAEIAFATHDVFSSDVQALKSAAVADLDGDGDVDVLSGSRGRIAWYGNIDGKGSFSKQMVITTAVGDPYSVVAADLDGDGDLDVLATSSGTPSSNGITWYENVDGNGLFGEQRDISTARGGARSVYAVDLDGDGDMDVLSASSRVAWHENTDGRGTFAEQQIISDREDKAWSVTAVDVDGDGDNDVVSGSVHKIAWYENLDGDGTFGSPTLIEAETQMHARAVHAADLDGDGDMDVLSGASNTVAWHENTDSKGTFGNRRLVAAESEFIGIRSVHAADVDSDGDLDVLSAGADFGDGRISWQENIDGKGTFGPARFLSGRDGGWWMSAADIDSDGDLDALSASLWKSQVAWYENRDSKGDFGPPMVFTSATHASSMVAVDVDKDRDLDLVSNSWFDRTINWFENLDGKGSFGPKLPVGVTVYPGLPVQAADIDGDGDSDVIAASVNNSLPAYEFAWYENVDGEGTFGDARVIEKDDNAAEFPYSLTVTDLDGDGDADVLSTWHNDIDWWYENTDGKGNFGPKQESNDKLSLSDKFSVDLDIDGDADKLVWLDGTLLAWREYLGPFDEPFGEQRIIASNVRQRESIVVADLDGDGDVDLASDFGFGNIKWFENLSVKLPGDADRNGVFDQLDVVQVLQVGKYLTGKAATFQEGDWNGDGVFDQLDIRTALQSNSYRQER